MPKILCKAVQVYAEGNAAPSGLGVVIDVSAWVPLQATSFNIRCALGRAPACTSGNLNAVGTVDMSWIGFTPDDRVNAQDKFLQIAMHGQVPGSLQEISGGEIEFPVNNGLRQFVYKTQCPDQHDYYDCAAVWFWLTGWTLP